MEPQQWLERCARLGAWWQHAGDPAQPHFVLGSGHHTDHTLNVRVLSSVPTMLAKVAAALLPQVRTIGQPDWVFSMAPNGIAWAYELARQLGCRAGFVHWRKGKLVVKYFPLEPGAQVLVAPPSLSSGEGTAGTIAIIEAAGAQVLPILCTIVQYAPAPICGRPVIALLELEPSKWPPKQCPLCRQGSPAFSWVGWQRLITPTYRPATPARKPKPRPGTR